MPRFDRFCLGLSSGLTMVALCTLANAQATLQIMPASPRYQEPVYARITPDRMSGLYLYGAKVSMSGTGITIVPEAIIEIGAGPYFDVELGRFPTGDFTVYLQDPLGPASAQFTVGPRMPQGPTNGGGPGTVPAVNFSGMWWNDLEPGWGLSISQGATNRLFAVWFVYNVAGTPTWYTLELGGWRVYWNDSEYSGSIYEYTGPYFATAFDPNKVAGTLVGTGTLTFWDPYRGRFDFTIAGTSGSKVITRLPIE